MTSFATLISKPTMEELALRDRRGMQVPIIKLKLLETNIPEDAFPTEQSLLLPTYARLTVKDATLQIDLILRDSYDDERDDLPDFDEQNSAILPLSLPRNNVFRLDVNGSWKRNPSAQLYVGDPGGVYDELYFLFGPWSKNNPRYHIDAFAKMLQNVLDVPVKYQEQPEEPQWPF